MAQGFNTTPGNWGRGSRSSSGVRGRFSGTRGYTMPKTASGQSRPFIGKPLRGEQDLYSMLGRPVGDEMSPYAAGMVGGDFDYIPPGTGVGTGYEGYGSGFMSEYGGGPGGAGDLWEQGSGSYEGPYNLGKNLAADMPPGFNLTGKSPIFGLPGGGYVIDDPIYGPGQGLAGGDYMQEDYVDPRQGFEQFMPDKIKPGASESGGAASMLRPPGLPGSYDFEDFMDSPRPGGAFNPSDSYDPTLVGTGESMQSPRPIYRRKGIVCPPGDPNCR
tara:strand:+ start:9143 stop:9958 length:816 start_codon:yes stop_codon:yes gene_type:complete